MASSLFYDCCLFPVTRRRREWSKPPCLVLFLVSVVPKKKPLGASPHYALCIRLCSDFPGRFSKILRCRLADFFLFLFPLCPYSCVANKSNKYKHAPCKNKWRELVISFFFPHPGIIIKRQHILNQNNKNMSSVLCKQVISVITYCRDLVSSQTLQALIKGPLRMCQ